MWIKESSMDQAMDRRDLGGARRMNSTVRFGIQAVHQHHIHDLLPLTSTSRTVTGERFHYKKMGMV